MACVFNNVKLEELEYQTHKQNQTGGKSVFVSTVADSNEFKHRLRFQMSEDHHTNQQCAVYGVSTPMPGQEDKRRSLELSIESPQLLAFLQQLDAHNIDVATKNSTEWFKRPLDRTQVEAMYVSMVKEPPPDKGYKHTVRTKIKMNERFDSNVWVMTRDGDDDQYRKGDYLDITKSSKAVAIVETTGLWFASRTFGMSLVINDIMVWQSGKTGGFGSFVLAPNTVKTEVESMQM